MKARLFGIDVDRRIPHRLMAGAERYTSHSQKARRSIHRRQEDQECFCSTKVS
jgi:hypothetical protein